MKIIPEPISFDWDKGNIDKNLERHNVEDKEAEEPFLKRFLYTFEDQKHSAKEKRYGLFGQTNRGRRLSIVFTIRKGKIRIITARDMSRRERRSYKKIKVNSKIQK